MFINSTFIGKSRRDERIILQNATRYLSVQANNTLLYIACGLGALFCANKLKIQVINDNSRRGTTWMALGKVLLEDYSSFANS